MIQDYFFTMKRSGCQCSSEVSSGLLRVRQSFLSGQNPECVLVHIPLGQVAVIANNAKIPGCVRTASRKRLQVVHLPAIPPHQSLAPVAGDRGFLCGFLVDSQNWVSPADLAPETDCPTAISPVQGPFWKLVVTLARRCVDKIPMCRAPLGVIFRKR